MILVVDDDISIRTSVCFLLKHEEYETVAVGTPAEALDVLSSASPDLILMDMNFSIETSGKDGLELLQKIKRANPQIPVILMTAWGSIPLAVEGMRLGAFDFITKPWDNMMLLSHINMALELSGKPSGRKRGLQSADKEFDRSLITGNSAALLELLKTVKKVAKTDAPVLITGESGTGKELVAKTLHNNSLRVEKPFVEVNLGGISQTLFESEMFGHKKGAFTDAVNDRVGRFALADTGTIFLDEIGELDLHSQVKLLRVLQEQTFERLGDSKTYKTNARVICATNANLEKMVAEKTFREDLYYRINLIHLHLPALRERREDIAPLVKFFSENLNAEFTADAIFWLSTLPYPGNIRELKNLVERCILICGKPLLELSDVKRIASDSLCNNDAEMSASISGMTLEDIDKVKIEQTIKQCGGNLSMAAGVLGISRQALYRRMEKFGLKKRMQ